MPPSGAFDGNLEVTLRAECTGNRLALFANGMLDEQTDLFSTGYGPLAASYTEEVTGSMSLTCTSEPSESLPGFDWLPAEPERD
jgi:hypothetical protein